MILRAHRIIHFFDLAAINMVFFRQMNRCQLLGGYQLAQLQEGKLIWSSV